MAEGKNTSEKKPKTETTEKELDALLALMRNMLIAFEGGLACDVCTLWWLSGGGCVWE